MTVLTVNPVALTANVEADSASRLINARMSSVMITMVDPNTQWPAAVDNSRHVKVWGVQLNRNLGAGWVWWLFQGDPSSSAFLADGETVARTADPSLWLPFGSRTRSGGMPWLSVGATDLAEAAGFSVRLGILTDANVILGATVTVT